MRSAATWESESRRALGCVADARPSRHRTAAAVVVGLVPGLLLAGCGSVESGPTTARVVQGSVVKTVSATGTLQAISEQNMGFPKSGKLVNLMVTVGQQVQAGQVLARIDDFDAQADLAQAQARLDKEQARLDGVKDDNKAEATSHDHNRAQDVLNARKDEADSVDEANDRAIEDAEKRIDEDREGLRRARAEAQTDQTRCNRSVTGNSHRYDGYGDNADVTTKDRRGLLLESPLDVHSPTCERAENGKSEVIAYQRRIQSNERALQAARRRADIDHARNRVAVADARRDAGAAGDAADGAATDRPHYIDERQAVVDDAAQEVRRAQRDVDDTLLRASVSGTVASINGTVGEHLDAAAGTTPLAPGGRASLPDMESGVGGKDDTGNQARRPGGPSFITLKDVNSYQVVVPFEEADASQVRPNQKVQLTFDAVADLTREGTVAAIAPTGTKINDVTNYYATIVLNETDPRLKSGQTTEVKVITGSMDNVLVVPTAAVERGGDTGVVQVLDGDGKSHPVQVQLGMSGDITTQILAGLREGQQVVLAQ